MRRRLMAAMVVATGVVGPAAEAGEPLPRVIRPSVAAPAGVSPPVLFRLQPAPGGALLPSAPVPAADSADWAACGAAIAEAEREHDLPPGLLAAIARVETGRRHPSGAILPWPWSLNVAGQGRYFATRAEAEAEATRLRAAGVTRLDVGCLQVSLAHHPAAFASVAEAFEPAANARYAARFLRALFAQHGDWGRAAAAYHSATPAFAVPYHARVAAAWAALGGPVLPPLPLPTIAAAAERGVEAGRPGAAPHAVPAGPPQPRVIRAIAFALQTQLR